MIYANGNILHDNDEIYPPPPTSHRNAIMVISASGEMKSCANIRFFSIVFQTHLQAPSLQTTKEACGPGSPPTWGGLTTSRIENTLGVSAVATAKEWIYNEL